MTTRCEVARRKNRRSTLYGMCGPGGFFVRTFYFNRVNSKWCWAERGC